VPYRVVRNDGEGREVAAVLLVRRVPGGPPGPWRVVGTAARRPGERVGSEGGARPAAMPPVSWLVVAALAVAVAAGTEMALARAGWVRPGPATRGRCRAGTG
jgi:hypothetical protein